MKQIRTLTGAVLAALMLFSLIPQQALAFAAEESDNEIGYSAQTAAEEAPEGEPPAEAPEEGGEAPADPADTPAEAPEAPADADP
ncbi:MAG: hypothetical protein IJ751_10760, partial [Oscillospiraceae bacterium]|nr:hypothetical protein [Oscillospiraceae bacterium]